VDDRIFNGLKNGLLTGAFPNLGNFFVVYPRFFQTLEKRPHFAFYACSEPVFRLVLPHKFDRHQTCYTV